MKKVDTPTHIITGVVIHGRGKGSKLGVPTTNIQPEKVNDVPENGVYITRVIINEKAYHGVTHIGTRPTMDADQDISIETHILNFQQDIYGEKMEIQFYQKLRELQKFDSVELLLEQIHKDCQAAIDYWKFEA